MTLEEIEQKQKQGIREIVNKTRQYLVAPVIRYYGDELLNNLRGLYTYACGINDSEKPKDYHLYLLIDMRKSRKPECLDKIISLKYVDNYPFGEILGGKLHMITVEIPDVFKPAYDSFVQSKYSKMFSKEHIKKYIIDAVGMTKAAQTMLKLPERREEFEQEVNYYRKYYATESEIDQRINDITWITIPEENELDYLINPKEEIFNYK